MAALFSGFGATSEDTGEAAGVDMLPISCAEGELVRSSGASWSWWAATA